MPEPIERTRAKAVLAREDGGIDLPSTMVSILVVAAFLAAAALAVFVVIPWSQDNAAKQLTGQVAEAQSAYHPMSAERDPDGDPHYGTKDQLGAAGLITTEASADADVRVMVANTTATGGAGAGTDEFLVTVSSATGREFLATSTDPQPGPNPVPNASFESGTQGWQPSNSGGAIIPVRDTDTPFGSKAAVAGAIDAGMKFASDGLGPAAAGGQVWELSFAYRIQNPSANTELFYSLYQTGQPANQGWTRLQPEALGQWRLFTTRVSVLDGTTRLVPILNIRNATGPANSTVAVDQVMLRRIQ